MSRRKKHIDVLEFLRNDWFINWLREDIKTRDFASQTKKKMVDNWKIKHAGISKKFFTDKQKKKIKTMWDRGVPYSRIAKNMHVDPRRVKLFIKEIEDGRKNRS